MVIVQNHEIQQFGLKIGKTEILHLEIAARKFAWKLFPAYFEFNNLTSILHFKGFISLLFTS